MDEELDHGDVSAAELGSAIDGLLTCESDQLRALMERIRKPLTSDSPRRHHFIPQHLLKHFSNNGRLNKLDLSRPNVCIPCNVRDTAVVKDLNTVIDSEIGETAMVEELLAVVDESIVQPFDRLRLGVIFPPNISDRAIIALWLALLYVRGPHVRRMMEALGDQTYKMEFAFIRNEDSARAYLRSIGHKDPSKSMITSLLELASSSEDWEIAFHQNEFVFQMLDSAKFISAHLKGNLYSVVKFPCPGLVLADNPIALIHDRDSWQFGGVGIASASEIWLPLDRSTLLIAHTDIVQGETVKRERDGSDIDQVNQIIVNNARREIYCHPDDWHRLQKLKLPPAGQPLLEMQAGERYRMKTDGVNSPPHRSQPRRYKSP